MPDCPSTQAKGTSSYGGAAAGFGDWFADFIECRRRRRPGTPIHVSSSFAMEGPSCCNQRDREAVGEVCDALSSSLELPSILAVAQPLLARALDADHAALAHSVAGRPDRFEWTTLNLPSAFFESYADFAAHDFVRHAVEHRAQCVLRDSEMVSRRDLEASLMYQRARELGTPLEHVMSVMLSVGPEWRAGVSFYRAARRPFTDRQRDLLRAVTPALSNALRNCYRFACSERHGRVLEQLLGADGRAVLVLRPPELEIARTSAATKLIDRWFPARPAAAARLPDALLLAVRRWSAEGDTLPCLTLTGRGTSLVVRPRRFSESGAELLALVFDEIPVAAPPWDLLLTPRERQVALNVGAGYSNRVIADELCCKEATVKKHLQRAFDKLGVSSRAQLMVRVQAERR